jgi:hypothetical protein
MKVWYDEKSGCKFAKPNCVAELLDIMWGIGFDYDGCNTVKSLKELIDELMDMTKEAMVCLRNGYLFPDDVHEGDVSNENN